MENNGNFPNGFSASLRSPKAYGAHWKTPSCWDIKSSPWRKKLDPGFDPPRFTQKKHQIVENTKIGTETVIGNCNRIPWHLALPVCVLDSATPNLNWTDFNLIVCSKFKASLLHSAWPVHSQEQHVLLVLPTRFIQMVFMGESVC